MRLGHKATGPVARRNAHTLGAASTRVPRSLPSHVCHVSKQLLQLERAVLADWTNEQLQHQLGRMGVSLTDDADQQQQQQHSQQPQPHEQQQQDQQQQAAADALQQAAAARGRRVAAAQSRRLLLLGRLAAARVAARARVVRLPLRLTVAGRAGSRRYLTVPADVDGLGFVDFLLDGSAYLSRITPRLRDRLGMGPADGVPIVIGSTSSPSGSSSRSGSGSSVKKAVPSSSSSSSSSAGASTAGGGGSSSSSSSSSASSGGTSSSSSRLRLRQRVQLPDMWLGTEKLPRQQAYVSPLMLPPRQQRSGGIGSSSASAQAATAVGGILGVQVLRGFELDVDVLGNELALHPAGHADLGLLDVAGLAAVPCRLSKSGAIVVPVSLAGSPPFTGLLDLSAATSILNWEAAALLGMTCREAGGTADGDGSSSSPNGQGQQQQQQPLVRSLYGFFGSIEIVPDQLLLKRPLLPHSQQQQRQQRRHAREPQQQRQQQRDGSSAAAGAAAAAAAEAAAPPMQLHAPESSSSSSTPPGSSTAGDSSSSGFVDWSGSSGADAVGSAAGGAASSSGSSGGKGRNLFANSSNSSSSFSLLRVQKHQVAASNVRLVLGHARLAAAAAAGTPGSSAAGGLSSLALAPPARLGVAGLRGLSQLGLAAGQPVMVIGADVWARERAVLCLRAGRLYLPQPPAESQQ